MNRLGSADEGISGTCYGIGTHGRKSAGDLGDGLFVPVYSVLDECSGCAPNWAPPSVSKWFTRRFRFNQLSRLKFLIPELVVVRLAPWKPGTARPTQAALALLILYTVQI